MREVLLTQGQALAPQPCCLYRSALVLASTAGDRVTGAHHTQLSGAFRMQGQSVFQKGLRVAVSFGNYKTDRMSKSET